jgi:predicted transcriptional regulator
MPRTSLTKPELQIMDVLWTRGACSVREIHDALPAKGRPAFTTIQTVVYRLEKKQALRCVKRISNANIFEAVLSRDDAHTTLVDELLSVFGGRPKPVMARHHDTPRHRGVPLWLGVSYPHRCTYGLSASSLVLRLLPATPANPADPGGIAIAEPANTSEFRG